LTLRVFLPTNGEACAGEVYTDDGHSFDFRNGQFARVHFTCSVAADGSVHVEIAKQEGNWRPWWHDYRVEVVSWKPKATRASVNGKNLALTQMGGRWGATVPANADDAQIVLE
jgi:alpha-glucosidase